MQARIRLVTSLIFVTALFAGSTSFGMSLACKNQMYKFCPKSFTQSLGERINCVKRSIPRLSSLCRKQYYDAFGTVNAPPNPMILMRQKQKRHAAAAKKGKTFKSMKEMRSYVRNGKKKKVAAVAASTKPSITKLTGERRAKRQKALYLLIMSALFIYTVCTWRLFSMAGYPGWYALVPLLNLYVFVEIAGRPGWWMFLFFVPVVNLFVYLMVSVGIAERTGRTHAFGVGLAALPVVFYPILVFE